MMLQWWAISSPGPRHRHSGDTLMIANPVIHVLHFVSCLLAICTAQQPDDFTDIRLVGGPVTAPNSGRVEVLQSTGIWLNVCDYNYWGDNDGQVACRQLGFPGYSRTRRASYFGEGPNNGSVGAIGCNGDEDSLGQCQHQTVRENIGCEGRVAGLICTAPGFLGCYVNNRNNRVFSNSRFSAENMTIGLCLDRCRRLEMRYAGLENTRYCYCGDNETQIDRNSQRADRDCRSSCLGNLDEVCGGRGMLSIYDLTLGHCTDPGTPANGVRESLSGDVFRYAANITFYCNDGFELVGADAARCVLGDSPQEVIWDEPIPQCRYLQMSTTSNPENGDKLNRGVNAGKIAGIIVACVIGFIACAILIVLVIRYRRRGFDQNANMPSGKHMGNVYAEPRDPTIHHGSSGLNTEYQDLASPSTDADRPYTALKKKGQQQETVKDIPEYLELDVDNPEYSSLDGELNNGGADAVGGGQSTGAGKQKCLPSPEIIENEYSYVEAPDFDRDSKEVTDSQGMNDKHKDGRTENPAEYSELGSVYYTIPPNAH